MVSHFLPVLNYDSFPKQPLQMDLEMRVYKLVRTKLASPDKRTGAAKTVSTLMDAAGFARCPLAMPA